VDESSISKIPGVQLVRKGRFLGVVAADEWSAVKAAAQLKVEWEIPQALPGVKQLHEKMRSAKTNDRVVHESGDVATAIANAPHKVSASFKSPYEAHAPFAPNCAVADVRADSADVYCSTQRLFWLRGALARVLKLQPEQVRVRYVESSGTFGHSGYDDVATAAALLSQAVGKPVRVQFSRADEHGWDNFGPAHLAEIRAAASADGRLVALEYSGWQHGWNFVVEPSEELALDAKIPDPVTVPAAGINNLTAGGVYSIPNRRVINHTVNGLEGYLKGSFLRSPLDLSISFASEQAIDELAHQAKLDPVEFRRKNVTDPRWHGVLDAVLAASKWTPRLTGEKKSGDVVQGTGVALGTHFQSYGASIAEIAEQTLVCAIPFFRKWAQAVSLPNQDNARAGVRDDRCQPSAIRRTGSKKNTFLVVELNNFLAAFHIPQPNCLVRTRGPNGVAIRQNTDRRDVAGTLFSQRRVLRRLRPD
jgi:CO/xanthine dehydrogenase Mo-binding subunit